MLRFYQPVVLLMPRKSTTDAQKSGHTEILTYKEGGDKEAERSGHAGIDTFSDAECLVEGCNS